MVRKAGARTAHTFYRIVATIAYIYLMTQFAAMLMLMDILLAIVLEPLFLLVRSSSSKYFGEYGRSGHKPIIHNSNPVVVAKHPVKRSKKVVPCVAARGRGRPKRGHAKSPTVPIAVQKRVNSVKNSPVSPCLPVVVKKPKLPIYYSYDDEDDCEGVLNSETVKDHSMKEDQEKMTPGEGVRPHISFELTLLPRDNSEKRAQPASSESDGEYEQTLKRVKVLRERKKKCERKKFSERKRLVFRPRTFKRRTCTEHPMQKRRRNSNVRRN